MAAIKQLAGQTLWYGLSNVGARMLNFLLTPLLTLLMNDGKGLTEYGSMTLIYSWMGVLNILYTYGMETAYFRFSTENDIKKQDIFSTAFGSLLISTVLFSLALIFFRGDIQSYLEISNHPEYITWCAFIVSLDAIAAIPFAKLRQEGRPRKYAFIRLGGILINIAAIIIFMVFIPRLIQSYPDNMVMRWFQGKDRLGFIILANLLQSIFVMLMLLPECSGFRLRINGDLWKRMVGYSAPMIVIGLGGMVNEVMDRTFLDKWLPFDNATNKTIVGIYGANYKLAIFITLFLQAFKMAAEPFFFSQAKDKNAPALYARIMKWFVITLAFAFLFTALYLDIWKILIIRGENFRSGIGVVPILLLANIWLGIYYNLSIWYKLTDRMLMGLYITVAGAVITLAGNYLFIPTWGMYASAWSTFICYFVMMMLAYFLGQKYFPIPYPVKKLSSYLVVMLLLFFAQKGVDVLTSSLNAAPQISIRFATATILFLIFLLLVIKIEKSEIKGMPFIGKYIK